jgi:hypothetical protein
MPTCPVCDKQMVKMNDGFYRGVQTGVMLLVRSDRILNIKKSR